jgi:hypothetical protein
MPRTSKTATVDESVWNAALEGLEIQRRRIEEQIANVKRLIGRRGPGRRPAAPTTSGAKPARRRTLSAAARKRIAAAQKRRWAEYRKKSGQG